MARNGLRKMNKHPYTEYKKTELWRCLEEAILELEKNKDIELMTAREYVVGYLCRKALTKGAYRTNQDE